MDIEKLSKISGLKPTEEMKKSLEQSLQGVFEMMQSIESMPDNDSAEQTKTLTEFNSTPSHLISKDEKHENIHLSDGFFLAPKVIQKN